MHIWQNTQIPILQLGSDFYDEATPAVFPQKKLRYTNEKLNLDFSIDRLWNFSTLENNIPHCLALK